MSVGLPAVSFSCPCGPLDIITNEKDGLLVRNGDTDRLAKQICFMIEHKDLRQKMGCYARQKSQEFYPDIIMKLWIELFESL